MKRVVIPELLDTDAGTPQEVADSLADLRMFNRRFGGARVTAELLREVAMQRGLKAVSFLDVGGASGDIAMLARPALRKSGIAMETVLLDRAPTHLNGELPGICGDALALPFPANAFDVVGCALFVHHLEPEQIVAFANEALRVARHAFVVNDLLRNRMHWGFARLGSLIYKSRLTVHDSAASVSRAYTVDEMRGILGQTNAARVEIKKFYFFRMGVIAWKQPSTI
jgi:ubiquinone/menaquinone biosynthesis C-methylase UbiE